VGRHWKESAVFTEGHDWGIARRPLEIFGKGLKIASGLKRGFVEAARRAKTKPRLADKEASSMGKTPAPFGGGGETRPRAAGWLHVTIISPLIKGRKGNRFQGEG